MKAYKILFSILICHILAMVTCVAQPNSSRSAGNGNEVRYVSFCSLTPINEPLYVRGGDRSGYTALTIPNRNRSAYYELEGAGKVILHRKVVDEQGRSNHVPVAEIAIPKEYKRTLVLVGVSGSQLRGIALDDSEATNAAGTLRAFNFTADPMICKFGSEQLMLQPKGGNKTVNVELAANDRMVMQIGRQKKNGDWVAEVNESPRMRNAESRRYLLFIGSTTIGAPAPGQEANPEADIGPSSGMRSLYQLTFSFLVDVPTAPINPQGIIRLS